VDDEESVRRALERLIRASGLDVTTFSTGTEFLESLKTAEPDCVVLDLHMPFVNGFEVQSRLAAAGSRVKVIVITGHDTEEYRERALKGGAAAYLRKPVDDELLLAAIQAAAAGNGSGVKARGE
jgi:FixJ family two-component response regulator